MDEDIYEIGERKRKLTTAVLSDKKMGGKSATKKRPLGAPTTAGDGGDNNDGNGDIGEIGRILQVPYFHILARTMTHLFDIYPNVSFYMITKTHYSSISDT